MSDSATLLITACGSLAAAGLVSVAFLRGWRGWLELKRLELGGMRSASNPSPIGRIELADLKERVRKLEAIANGTEG